MQMEVDAGARCGVDLYKPQTGEQLQSETSRDMATKVLLSFAFLHSHCHVPKSLSC